MNSILDIVNRTPDPAPWTEGDNIPWDDPEFSARMLAEHLSQEHDLASRRAETIDGHVEWIHSDILGPRPAKLLDLACGPGLYGLRLARTGCEYVGIDFSPASIEYARRNLPTDVKLEQDDLRVAEFGDGFNLVLLIYGEMNTFSPAECGSILERARLALVPGGKLLLEVHTFEAVQDLGKSPARWSRHRSGLFSERPDLYLTESHWDDDGAVAQQFFHIIESETATTATYTSTTKAWTREEYKGLLGDAGFSSASLLEGWSSTDPALTAWVAVR